MTHDEICGRSERANPPEHGIGASIVRFIEAAFDTLATLPPMRWLDTVLSGVGRRK